MSREEWRNRIDLIDKEILSKLEERMGIAEEIGKYKLENSLPVLDESREKVIHDKIVEMTNPEYREYILEVYDTILKVSKDLQQKVIDKNENTCD